MPFSIKAKCSRTYYPAYHDSGSRPGGWADIQYVVIHAEEAPTAAGAAHWFQNKDSLGSAHVCVDDYSCYRCLHPLKIAWGAPPLNGTGYHIEQAGWSAWSNLTWFLHRDTIKRAAYHTARMCKAAKIPVEWRSAKELRSYKHGITSHRNVSKAFGDTNHSDPGLFYPRRFFMKHVRKFYAEL